MAFDYCTTGEAFDYGGSAGRGSAPVNEAAVMAEIVTAVSRTIDERCNQSFSLETYTSVRVRARLSMYGVLSFVLPFPNARSVTNIWYRIDRATANWLSGTLADLEIVAKTDGSYCTLPLSAPVRKAPGATVDVQVACTGGYTTMSAMPMDLRLAARAAAWYEFQRRTAPLDKTAMPNLGIVIIPGDWPRHITSKLTPYTRIIGT